MTKKQQTCLHDHCCGGLLEELVCHAPYAILSVTMCFVVLGFLDFLSPSMLMHPDKTQKLDTLFHSFHFLHIVFSTTGAVVTFLRFSKRMFFGVIVSALSAAFFCFASDVLLPCVAGKLLGVDVRLHVCFYSELHNVLPFLLGGILNGLAISRWRQLGPNYYSFWTHFMHVFASASASLFYLLAGGLTDWTHCMGILFIFLVIIVVLPCTMSDLVIPMLIARNKENAPHSCEVTKKRTE